MGVDLRESIDAATAKLILGNAGNARTFLSSLGVPSPSSLSTNELYEKIAEHWDYEPCRALLRDQFRSTEKYTQGLSASARLSQHLNEWAELSLGPVKWPCSQGHFDDLTQRINTSNEFATGEERDDSVSLAAVRFRRMKEIKTAQNDMIETLVFEAHESVIPTFRHSRQCDFFIDGTKYDQKTAKSPGQRFLDLAGPHWREMALGSPSTVARYLYEGQDEGRFDADPRLYVVSLDGEGMSSDAIERSVQAASLESPETVTFSYTHGDGVRRSYTTQCITILLTEGDENTPSTID